MEHKEESGVKIRSAIVHISDRNELLVILREIANQHKTHIVCFDAEKLAGQEHAKAAVRHAIKSCRSGTPISNSFEMEALLFASGSRQCALAADFGLHEGENHLFVCCYPNTEGVWAALESRMCFVDDKWDDISPMKQERLADQFGITSAEIDATGSDCLQKLVLERVALLEVSR